MIRIMFLLSLALYAATSHGSPPLNCSKSVAEIDGAKEILNREASLAFEAISKSITHMEAGDSEIYAQYFGEYTEERASIVKKNLAVARDKFFKGGDITAACVRKLWVCKGKDDFACVKAKEPSKFYITPLFFSRLVTLFIARSTVTTKKEDFGTMGGALAHEAIHFNIHGERATYDYCYSRSSCAAWGQENPDLAIGNADNYQYFIEDAYWFGELPIPPTPVIVN